MRTSHFWACNYLISYDSCVASIRPLYEASLAADERQYHSDTRRCACPSPVDAVTGLTVSCRLFVAENHVLGFGLSIGSIPEVNSLYELRPSNTSYPIPLCDVPLSRSTNYK